MTAKRTKRRLFLVLCGLGVLIFSALGVWQIERLSWKLDLIERVDARVHAPAVPAPTTAEWPSLDPKAIEYRHVRATGLLRNDQETLIDALTERGPGYWVVAPLETGSATILVNRGFVPPELADRKRRVPSVSGPLTIVGLLRLSEPGGRFLRPNRPAAGRWFSRDVAAIARARGLSRAAPFFIDADASPNPGGYPLGGMTVIEFRNAHLIYAITWFALAALSVAGLVFLRRLEQKQEQEQE